MQSTILSQVTFSTNTPAAETKPVEDRVSLLDHVAIAIGAIPEVEAVFTAREGNVWHVWAVVHSPNPEVRKRIYAKEKSIIENFEGFNFDFNIIASRGVDPCSVIRDPDAKLIFKRKR